MIFIKKFKIISKFSKTICVWIFLLGNELSFAKPLLATNQQIWDENTKIFIANCPLPRNESGNEGGNESGNESVNENQRGSGNGDGNEKILFLKTPNHDKTFVFLDLAVVKDKEQSYLYAVSSEQEQTISKLYRFKFEQNNIRNHLDVSEANATFSLPFGAVSAYLSTGETNLLLTANESENSCKLRKSRQAHSAALIPQSYLCLFDVKDSMQDLSPTSQTVSGLQSKMKGLTSAQMIRLQNEGRAILFGGEEWENANLVSGALCAVCLDSLNSPKIIKTNSKQKILKMVALDTAQNNCVDVIYAWDSLGAVWKFDVKKRGETLQKIEGITGTAFEIERKNSVKTQKSLEAPGIDLYFFAKNERNKSALYRLTDLLEGAPFMKPIPMGARESGDNELEAETLYLRSGRLILVPKRQALLAQSSVYERRMKEEKRLNITWQPLFSIREQVSQEMQNHPNLHLNLVSQTLLLWDKRAQKEVLISLSEGCACEAVIAPVTQDKYQIQSWKKIKK